MQQVWIPQQRRMVRLLTNKLNNTDKLEIAVETSVPAAPVPKLFCYHYSNRFYITPIFQQWGNEINSARLIFIRGHMNKRLIENSKIVCFTRQCQIHLDAYFCIKWRAVEGEGLCYRGLGIFNCGNRRHDRRNPGRGLLPNPPRNSVKFKPGKQLLKRINTKAGEE